MIGWSCKLRQIFFCCFLIFLCLNTGQCCGHKAHSSHFWSGFLILAVDWVSSKGSLSRFSQGVSFLCSLVLFAVVVFSPGGLSRAQVIGNMPRFLPPGVHTLCNPLPWCEQTCGCDGIYLL